MHEIRYDIDVHISRKQWNLRRNSTSISTHIPLSLVILLPQLLITHNHYHYLYHTKARNNDLQRSSFSIIIIPHTYHPYCSLPIHLSLIHHSFDHHLALHKSARNNWSPFILCPCCSLVLIVPFVSPSPSVPLIPPVLWCKNASLPLRYVHSAWLPLVMVVLITLCPPLPHNSVVCASLSPLIHVPHSPNLTLSSLHLLSFIYAFLSF